MIVPATQATPSLPPSRPQSHSLLPLLVDAARLRRAARQCMRRCSSPGVDHVTWRDYRVGMPQRLADLSTRLRAGTWQPAPVRLCTVTTFAGKQVQVGIPTVEDRIVHRALRATIEPVLETCAFPPWVSGFRPGRSRLTAVTHAAGHIKAGDRWIADVDVADVAGGGTPEEVVGWLHAWVTDGTVLARVRTALAGLPRPLLPGSGLSPLLVNLRLVAVDQQLTGWPVVRFCDNYCVFTRCAADATVAYQTVEAALASVGLRPAPAKSRIHTMHPEDLFLLAG